MTERNHTLSKDKLAEFKETQKDDKKKHALHCSLKIYKNERHQLVLKEKNGRGIYKHFKLFFVIFHFFYFFISLFIVHFIYFIQIRMS